MIPRFVPGETAAGTRSRVMTPRYDGKQPITIENFVRRRFCRTVLSGYDKRRGIDGLAIETYQRASEALVLASEVTRGVLRR